MNLWNRRVLYVGCFIFVVWYTFRFGNRRLPQEAQNETEDITLLSSYNTSKDTFTLERRSVIFLDSSSTFPPQPLAIGAVESAALIYKDRTVYFLLRGLTNASCLEDKAKYPGLNFLTSLHNVKILTLDPELVLDSTPLLAWYNEVTYKNTYWTKFAALAFQLALAWKYGGIFISTKYISMTPILEQNFVLQKKAFSISNEVFGFMDRNQFVWNCMEDLIFHYTRAVWGQHSPNVLTRQVNILCNNSATYSYHHQDSLCDTYKIKLFRHLNFCPVSYEPPDLLNLSVITSYQNQTESYERQHNALPVLNKLENRCLKKYCPGFYQVFVKTKETDSV